MKYRDRSTIKMNSKWTDKKENQLIEPVWYNPSKKDIKRWAAKIPMSMIWWESLSDGDKSSVYFDFNYRKKSIYVTGIELSDQSIIKELYDKYKPRLDVKRELIINDLLKNCL